MSDATGLEVAGAIRALAGRSTAEAIGIAPGKAFTPEEFGALGEALGGVGSVIVLAQRVVDPVQVVRFHDGETSRGSRVATSFADAMLRDASWRVVELLRDAGYRAAIARNLRYGAEGTRAHAISFKKAGVLAGLGTVGRSGLLIHPEWGPWLLMNVVVTDAELPSDQPRGDSPCAHCEACIQACPAGALSADGLDREACRNRLGPDGVSLDQVLSPHGRISCDECGRACPIGLAPPRLGEGGAA
jgi:epoxyqueuosine reductase QueG